MEGGEGGDGSGKTTPSPDEMPHPPSSGSWVSFSKMTYLLFTLHSSASSSCNLLQG